MDYIESDMEKEAFQDENTFRKSQQEFSKFIQYAEAWQVLEFYVSNVRLASHADTDNNLNISGSYSGRYYSQFGSNGRIQIC